MKRYLLAFVFVLCASFASAQDDCPAGHIRNPQVSALDHDYMLRAFTASFRGLFKRDPSMQPGSGKDDGEYYISASNHYGVYGDDQCHAGWSGYWESWLQDGHGDLTLVQTPARFLPGTVPTPDPTPVPVPTPAPSVDLAPILAQIAALTQRVAADEHVANSAIASFEARIGVLEARKIPASCRASVFGTRISCTLVD
jgi:hypothetical protein